MQIVQIRSLVVVRRLVQFIADWDCWDRLKPRQIVDAEPPALDLVVPLRRQLRHQPQDVVRSLHNFTVGVLQQLHDLLHDLRLSQDHLPCVFV